MKYSELTEQEKIFLSYMEKARAYDPALYLAAIAISCTPGTVDDIDWAGGFTRNVFKRAVSILRGMQEKAPQFTDVYEDAITFVQAEWLCRKTA